MIKRLPFILLLCSVHLTSHAIYGIQTLTFVNTSASSQWLSVYTPAFVNEGQVLDWFQNRIIVPSGSVLSPSYLTESFPSTYEYDSSSTLRIVNHLWFSDEVTSFSYDIYPPFITCHIAPNNTIACPA